MGLAVVLLAAVGGAAVDIRTGRIPNALTASTAGVGLLLAVSGHGSIAPTTALLGGVVGLLLMMPGHVIGGTGAGDVKLMAGLGTLLGPGATVVAFLATALAGGVLAVAHAWWRGRLGSTLARTARLTTAPVAMRAEISADRRATRFAYGPAIAVGAVAAVLWG